MSEPTKSVTLSAEQIAEVGQRLADLRHNVNNQLSLIVAAIELIRRKPDMAPRLIETIAEQPPKVLQEMKIFSDRLEATLGIVRVAP